jgi:hypothetical protein
MSNTNHRSENMFLRVKNLLKSLILKGKNVLRCLLDGKLDRREVNARSSLPSSKQLCK